MEIRVGRIVEMDGMVYSLIHTLDGKRGILELWNNSLSVSKTFKRVQKNSNKNYIKKNLLLCRSNRQLK